ncbi:Maf1-domain-containing protein [Hesseltinella vesiculosa]|uniref:Repressor of RNA polymerase III transcription MAF1 n=1 Tax=Hesseltinella vesiculosa TaxID=101127 RepID=A0A1X2GJW6_9FUNG|nr:Maf1-domain-containing protein [Hesseltinella vesiculosa]
MNFKMPPCDLSSRAKKRELFFFLFLNNQTFTMKFLQVDSLDMLNSVFEWESAEAQLTGRIEAYSCKTAGSDKKLFKHMESKYNILAPGSLSPEEHIPIVSPFGRLDESAPRKTFFYLLATMNAAFPDYDFSDVRPDQFVKQPSTDLVINSVNTTLFNLGNPVIVNQYRWSMNYFFLNRKLKRMVFFSVISRVNEDNMDDSDSVELDDSRQQMIMGDMEV